MSWKKVGSFLKEYLPVFIQTLLIKKGKKS